MPSDGGAAAAAIEAALRKAMPAACDRPFILAICGAQGSGKSTLSDALARSMRAGGTSTAILSIDDIYLTKAERKALARDVHPLFAVRGAPGTHDVALGREIIGALRSGRGARLPRFDKARDDRAPESAWDEAAPDTALLILEGWCVAARPQDEAALVEPVNDLERVEDGDGRWRRAVNAALAADYAALFAPIDMLVLLAAPDFEVVRDWRIEQEHKLARSAGAGAEDVMTDAEVERFIRFYERLTRHILVEMPDRADLVIHLARDRTPLSITERQRGDGGISHV